jgi:hypothetical protein
LASWPGLMRGKLEDFEPLIELREERYRAGRYDYSDEVRMLDAAIRRDSPTAREILTPLDPGLAGQVEDPSYDGHAGAARAAVQQALGILRDQDEWKAHLEPDAPAIDASRFHPAIWDAAAVIWETGQSGSPSGRPRLRSLPALSKAKSNLTERELVNEVLAPTEPAARRTRLHFPGDKRTKYWKSRQEGLHHIAQGAYAGIRNIAAHHDDELTEHAALEQLAVLSVIARWADETELVTGGQP